MVTKEILEPHIFRTTPFREFRILITPCFPRHSTKYVLIRNGTSTVSGEPRSGTGQLCFCHPKSFFPTNRMKISQARDSKDASSLLRSSYKSLCYHDNVSLPHLVQVGPPAAKDRFIFCLTLIARRNWDCSASLLSAVAETKGKCEFPSV